MRIATSSIYDSQINAIDNLTAQQQQYGAELSSGKQLQVPSDNPSAIGQDLAVGNMIAQENQGSQNITNATAQLNAVDGALSSLSDVMTKARSIAVQGASGFVDPTQRQALASQVDSLLQETVSLANTKYAGQFVFAGSAGPSTQPVNAVGQPISSVTFAGNTSRQTQKLYNGDSVTTGVTLQQAFNFNSADGSPDVFQTLIALRNSLQNDTVTSQSAARVNATNTAFSAGPAPAAQPINTAGILATPLVADANGNVNISITSTSAPNGVTIAIPATSTVPGVLAAINAQSAATGVSASFDYRRQQLVLTSASGNFQLGDVASAGAPSAGNFTTAFRLQTSADLTSSLSRQLADIDNATQSMLTTRSSLGGTIQSLTALGQTTSSQVVNDTKVQSNIEDADISKVISQFSQSQTALQAAYGTTTRLEGKSLFDYLQ
ncbi:MAG TPA: flagellar hook-associated protein FlgL [Candidatus Baltobacteraceae bacterium]|nr:flagellar hook-associated protein FlgL [Candidatus Baltobacteraceae bacterium]